MSQGPLCPNLSQKVQKEVSKMANHNLSPVILLGGLSVNLNHLKLKVIKENSQCLSPIVICSDAQLYDFLYGRRCPN